MTAIAISRVHFPITTLGPGNRLGIWMQGCSIRCPGCISADTWAFGKGMVNIDDLLGRLDDWVSKCEGITISGGEPFDQFNALFMLLRGLRPRTAADILVYSGYRYEQLEARLGRLGGLVDALITDPFIVDAAQTLPLRGSDNQRLWLLTPLGRHRFSGYCQPTKNERAFDVMFDDDGTVWLAGIPRRDDFRRFTAKLEALGHRVSTTEDGTTKTVGDDRR